MREPHRRLISMIVGAHPPPGNDRTKWTISMLVSMLMRMTRIAAMLQGAGSLLDLSGETLAPEPMHFQRRAATSAWRNITCDGLKVQRDLLRASAYVIAERSRT